MLSMSMVTLPNVKIFCCVRKNLIQSVLMKLGAIKFNDWNIEKIEEDFSRDLSHESRKIHEERNTEGSPLNHPIAETKDPSTTHTYRRDGTKKGNNYILKFITFITGHRTSSFKTKKWQLNNNTKNKNQFNK